MRGIKIMLLAMVATFFFGSADAQIKEKAGNAAHRRMVISRNAVRHYQHRHVIHNNRH
jgi:hypothetical protein